MGPLAQFCDRRDLDALLQFGGFAVTLVMVAIMCWGGLALQWVAILLYPLTFVWPWVVLPEVRAAAARVLSSGPHRRPPTTIITTTTRSGSFCAASTR